MCSGHSIWKFNCTLCHRLDSKPKSSSDSRNKQPAGTYLKVRWRKSWAQTSSSSCRVRRRFSAPCRKTACWCEPSASPAECLSSWHRQAPRTAGTVRRGPTQSTRGLNAGAAPSCPLSTWWTTGSKSGRIGCCGIVSKRSRVPWWA